MDTHTEKEKAYEIFSAVFSQKPAVSAKRIAILKAINKSAEGKMKFRDIFQEVQSEMKDFDYTSQKLTYDLQVLMRNALINKTWDGEYTITENGCSLLAMYQDIAQRIAESERGGRTGFVGEVNGRIQTPRFDFNVLGEELTRLPLLRKKFIASKDKFCLELKDDSGDIKSDIELRRSGHFSIRVILYRDNEEGIEDFLGDFEHSEEWYETARGIVQAIVYFIKRSVRKLWREAEIDVPLKPDSYPI